MTKYAGICVGGSYAGRFIEAPGPMIRVQKAEPGPVCFNKLCDISQVLYTEVETYQIHPIEFAEGVVWLWIPAGGTPFWAIKEMAETYAMYEDLK